jgi:hypothetical protein
MESIKRNISFEVIKNNIDNQESNNIEIEFDFDMKDYMNENKFIFFDKNYKNNKNEDEDEDDVKSLCPNTDDNVSTVNSDIDISELDYYMEKRNNTPVNTYDLNYKYKDYIIPFNEAITKNNNEQFKESNEYSRIHDLEFENQILKKEIRELKEKMQNFEIFMLNFKTSSPNNSCYDFSQMDKLKTMIKEVQFEMKKMKDQFEYLEALENENRDKIEVIETLMENIKD